MRLCMFARCGRKTSTLRSIGRRPKGGNPGLSDVFCFGEVDPGGFFIGEIDGRPVSTVSCVNYDERFAFLGFYIVRPDVRGRGYGVATWRAAITHAGGRTIGLDGVPQQQDNYRNSGFDFAYRNIRFGLSDRRDAMRLSAREAVVALDSVPLPVLVADDARVFPAPRAAFLRRWATAPGHVGRALLRDGELAGWGVLRPCRAGSKIGPLIADDRAAAETIFDALAAEAGDGPVYLDAPEPNVEALALVEDKGMEKAFETARMVSRASANAGARARLRRHQFRARLRARTSRHA